MSLWREKSCSREVETGARSFCWHLELGIPALRPALDRLVLISADRGQAQAKRVVGVGLPIGQVVGVGAECLVLVGPVRRPDADVEGVAHPGAALLLIGQPAAAEGWWLSTIASSSGSGEASAWASAPLPRRSLPWSWSSAARKAVLSPIRCTFRPPRAVRQCCHHRCGSAGAQTLGRGAVRGGDHGEPKRPNRSPRSLSSSAVRPSRRSAGRTAWSASSGWDSRVVRRTTRTRFCDTLPSSSPSRLSGALLGAANAG